MCHGRHVRPIQICSIWNELEKKVQMIFKNFNFPYRYEIMYNCWDTQPRLRPLFDALEKSISKLLTHDAIERYIVLNQCFLKANAINVDPDQPDYLAGIAALDDMDSSIPSYIESCHDQITKINETKCSTSDPVDSFANPVYDTSPNPNPSTSV